MLGRSARQNVIAGGDDIDRAAGIGKLSPAPPGIAGGLAVQAQYGDFDPEVSLASPHAWRMITLLRAL